VQRALLLYLAPIRWQPRLRRWAREAALRDASAHLDGAVRWLRVHPGWGAPTVVIDVGGAAGGVASYFASHIPACRVYCYEANPDFWAGLAARFSGSQVRVRQTAVGATRGTATLHITQNRLSSSLFTVDSDVIARYPATFRRALTEAASVAVPLTTLDAEFAAEKLPIGLLKLDVQGAELEVLRGARETLRRTYAVLTEMVSHRMYCGGCEYHEVDALLRSRGFRLVDIFVSFRGPHGVEEFDALYLRADTRIPF
jgi:FkbM family methyltransferase